MKGSCYKLKNKNIELEMPVIGPLQLLVNTNI